MLPDSLHLYTGRTNNWTSIDDDKEVITPNQGGPFGNGGDVALSETGDSVVFVTCRKDDYATNEQSSIWIHNMKTNQSYFVYNDPTKMERQPIFMGHITRYTTPPAYVRGLGQLQTNSADLGSVYTDSITAQTKFTVKATNGSRILITSIALSGTGASAYSVVSPTIATPVVVNGGATQDIVIAFKPTAVQQYDAVMTVKYRDSISISDGAAKDSILTATLTGKGAQRPSSGSVRAEAEAEFAMALVPNPFSSAGDVEVTAKNSGAVKLEVVDLTGRSLYSSESRYLASGEKTVFTLDAKHLSLVPGSYYILLHTPAGDVMRKAIVTR
jgi:hypothetical protein